MVKKKQKVRFHKGDKRPNKLDKKLKYKVEMAKEGKKILWHVIEKPTNNIFVYVKPNTLNSKWEQWNRTTSLYLENASAKKFSVRYNENERYGGG